MNNRQQGFTLIELVAVIVILGALAVVALPRFINLQDEAQTAALDGVKGAAGAAHAVNLAGKLASTGDSIPVTDCTNTDTDLMQNDPDGYTFGNGTGFNGGTADGDELECVVTQSATNATAAYTGYHVN